MFWIGLLYGGFGQKQNLVHLLSIPKAIGPNHVFTVCTWAKNLSTNLEVSLSSVLGSRPELQKATFLKNSFKKIAFSEGSWIPARAPKSNFFFKNPRRRSAVGLRSAELGKINSQRLSARGLRNLAKIIPGKGPADSGQSDNLLVLESNLFQHCLIPKIPCLSSLLSCFAN